MHTHFQTGNGTQGGTDESCLDKILYASIGIFIPTSIVGLIVGFIAKCLCPNKTTGGLEIQ